MVNMFTAQSAPAPQPTGATPATGTAPTGKPTGFFSAGNAFGQMAGQTYQNTQQYLQNNPLDYSSAPALPGVDDFSADRQRVEQAILGRARGELDTRYAQETADFEQMMANQGVDIGSERYKRERALFDKGRNEAYNDAGFRAMIAGGDEQSRLFKMGLEARKQSVDEQSALRASRIADLAAILAPAQQQEKLIVEQSIADKNNQTQRYGIDSVANTANLDRRSRDRTSNLDRRSRENLEKGRQRFEGRENQRNRNLTTSEGDKNRQVTREGQRRMGGANITLSPEDMEKLKPPGSTGAQ